MIMWLTGVIRPWVISPSFRSHPKGRGKMTITKERGAKLRVMCTALWGSLSKGDKILSRGECPPPP